MSDSTDPRPTNADPSLYDGCGIPPGIYDIGFGWDAGPEAERMLFLSREAGARVASALELGCGTGRLLECLAREGGHLARLGDVPDVVGIELSPAMAAFARARAAGATIVVGDMCDFALGRRFDLIYTSANTIRHVIGDDAIRRMWRCIADHLSPGGAFIADLELGIGHEADRLGRPATWTLSRGGTEVGVSWTLRSPPSRARPISTVEWEFTSRRDDATDMPLTGRTGRARGRIVAVPLCGTRRVKGVWRESFNLRAYDAAEFVDLATAADQLRLFAMYEPRDPFLHEVTESQAAGRVLVVLTRAA